MTYEYKLLNYLVQGSAADATKEAIIRHHNHPKREARFMVTVYDEINASAAKKRMALEMEILRETMESLEFDVPMLSDGKTGPNWGTLTKYKDPS
jgi:DNA polymerase I-like protein with 3'-5' exonuclease and polymerase domains